MCLPTVEAGSWYVCLAVPAFVHCAGMSKSNFNWNKYLKVDKSTAAPDKAFTAAQKAKPT